MTVFGPSLEYAANRRSAARPSTRAPLLVIRTQLAGEYQFHARVEGDT